MIPIRSGSGSVRIFDPVAHWLGLKKYNKMTTDVHLKTTMKSEYLPPTEGAVEKHILRCYFEYQDWVLLSSMTLSPTEYGWQIEADGSFGPVGTLAEMAPNNCLS